MNSHMVSEKDLESVAMGNNPFIPGDPKHEIVAKARANLVQIKLKGIYLEGQNELH